MSSASPKTDVPTAVVASIEDQLGARRRARLVAEATQGHAGNGTQGGEPSHTMTEADRLKVHMLRDWRLVKRARFNAARRLRNRFEAGQFAFAVSGIYGFLVPLFLLQFDGYLSNFAAMVISFVAAVAGALSFTIAMQYQQKDFKVRASQLHDCAREINNLSRHLTATQLARPEDLRPFIHNYDDILARCENHDDIDFALARLADSPRNLTGDALRNWRRERWVLKWRLYRQTYSVCAVVWLLPIVIGVIIWLSLAPKT